MRLDCSAAAEQLSQLAAASTGHGRELRFSVSAGSQPMLRTSAGMRLTVRLDLRSSAGGTVASSVDHSAFALGDAAGRGELAEVGRLLDAGADVDTEDERGVTPLHMAAAGGFEDVANVLIAAYAERTKGSAPAADLATGRGDSTPPDGPLMDTMTRSWLCACTDAGESALYFAAKAGHGRCVAMLMSRGARDTTQPARGHEGCGVSATHLPSALHAAAAGDHASCVRELVAGGSPINQRSCACPGNYSQTALSVAVMKSCRESITMLLDLGADVNRATADDGRTPLFIAAARSDAWSVCKLLKAGAHVHPSIMKPRLATNGRGETPIFMAAKKGDVDCLKELLAALARRANAPGGGGPAELRQACLRHTLGQRFFEQCGTRHALRDTRPRLIGHDFGVRMARAGNCSICANADSYRHCVPLRSRATPPVCSCCSSRAPVWTRPGLAAVSRDSPRYTLQYSGGSQSGVRRRATAGALVASQLCWNVTPT